MTTNHPASGVAEDVRVRRARDDELDYVGRLTAETYARDQLVGDVYLATVRDARAKASDANTALLVAVEGTADGRDQILGAVAYTRPGSSFTDIAEAGEAGFRVLVVDPIARGRGIGKLLVDACLARARAERFDRVAILTGPAMSTAQRLYTRMGFVPTPWRDRILPSGTRLLAYVHSLAPVIVRDAVAAEFDDVGTVTVEAYRADHLVDDTPASSGYVEVLRAAAPRAERARLLVAVPRVVSHAGPRAEEVVGTVTFAPYGTEYAEIARTGEAEFRMLAVAPDWRGRGVGAALVHACLDLARSTEATGLVLSMLDSSAAAHRIYARLGFIREPERDWEPVRGTVLRAWRRELVTDP